MMSKGRMRGSCGQHRQIQVKGRLQWGVLLVEMALLLRGVVSCLMSSPSGMPFA
jgi:hypothetical protein